MPQKELTAKVSLDISDIDKKLKGIEDRIKSINTTATKGSKSNAVEKQLADRQKLEEQWLRAADRHAAQVAKRQQKEADASYERWKKEEALRKKNEQREIDALMKQVQREEALKQKQEAAEAKQIQRAERLLSLERERERIRQQSLNKTTPADRASANMIRADKTAMYASMFDQIEAQELQKSVQQVMETARKLRAEWEKNHPILAKIQNGWTNIRTRIQEVISRHPKLQSAFNKCHALVDKVKNKLRQWFPSIKQAEDGNKRFNNSLKTSNTLVSQVWGKLKRLASTYLGIMGLKAMTGVSDTITGAENKLNYIGSQQLGASGTNTDGSYSNATLNATQQAMDQMYVSSQKVGMSYTDMMANVSKSMALAGDAFGGSTENAIRFQEIMAETYTLGGASAEEMSSSMYQLIQALGAGTLAGDELRSVREGAPLAYKAIEEFVQGIYETDESLKDLASQGKVTSEMVVAAMTDAGTGVDKAFANTEVTFAQTWTRIKNAAIQAFRPVSDMLSNMLNEAVENGLIQKIEDAFAAIAKGVMVAMKVIGAIVGWVVDNWNWLKWVILGTIGLIIAGSITMGIVNVVSAIQSAIAWMAANAALAITLITIFLIVAALLGLLVVFVLWKTGVIDTCTAVASALMIVGIAILLIGILAGSVPMMIIGGILLLAGVIFAFLDTVMGVVAVVVSFIANCVIGLINSMIQMLWHMFVEPFISIVEFILNCCNGGFTSFGGAVANLIGNIISWFLSLGKVVTTIIDAIFGTNWTGGLSSLQNTVLAWGKSDQGSITLSREAPQIGRLEYGTQWEAGKDLGASWKNSINNWGAGGQNWNLGNIGESLGLDLGNMFPDPNDPNNQVTGGQQPTAQELLDGIDKGNDIAAGTGGSVGDIADTMELAEEDLEFLRKLAELEWKKEYTVASITVDMTNNNNVSGTNDLDGIVTMLGDKLREELNSVADGVYA